MSQRFHLSRRGVLAPPRITSRASSTNKEPEAMAEVLTHTGSAGPSQNVIAFRVAEHDDDI